MKDGELEEQGLIRTVVWVDLLAYFHLKKAEIPL